MTIDQSSGAFTAKQVADANRRHDRYYGWDIQWPMAYTNAFRLPESVLGDIYEYWNTRSNNLTVAGS